MCIIIYKESGKTIKDEWLDNSAKNNADGFGLSYSVNNEVQIFKTMDYKKFKLTFRELEKEMPTMAFVLHFRKSTCGLTDITNCHPFLVENKAIFHNGSINKCKPSKEEKVRSDTRIFCEDILADLPENWIEYEPMLELIENYVGGSKLLFMEDDGTVTILHEESGHWIDGVWMSNYSYYPNTKSVQKNKPFAWNSNVKQGKQKKGGGVTNANRFLPVCYKHPEGVYTKYTKGVRFRWYPNRFMWGKIDIEGDPVLKNPESVYSDPPTQFNYRVIDAGYKLSQHQQEIEEQVKCDWCGNHSPKREYGIFSWNKGLQEDEKVKDDDKYLVCETCQEDLDIENFMEKDRNGNIDYYLCNSSRDLWAGV